MSRKAKRLMPVAGVVSLAVLLLFTTALASTPLLIDHFDVFQEIVLTAVGSNASQVNEPDALGGYRDIEAELVSWFGSGNLAVRANDQGDSLFSFSADGVVGRAILTWDGNDSPTTLNPSGLKTGGPGTGIDLTSGSSHDAFLIGVQYDDLPTTLRLTVYETASDYSYYDLALPGLVFSPIAYSVPFSGFTTVGAGAVFSDAGAITLEVVPSNGLDLRIHFMETTSSTNTDDYGDLPDSYGVTTFAQNGARHTATSLFLGYIVDTEEDGDGSAPGALNDDETSFDDEDGIVPSPGVNWIGGGNGSIDVTVTGCAGGCYLSGWIDWGNDNTLDAGDNVLLNAPLTNGIQTITFPIPVGADPSNNSFYTRFRLTDINTLTAASGFTGALVAGEVEDYLWSFGPTAVTLQALSAAPHLPSANLILLVIGGILVLGMLLVWTRRQRA